jgi:glycosyltransferase involved in cell wall biosynthesis
MRISVLTPTYNRGKLLNRLYYSLVKNLKFGIEIEWLIMDDGSTDQTEQLVNEFKEKKIKNLKIRYFKQENYGKMIAINNLIQYVTGEYMIDCDSDDYFTDNAFKYMKEKIESLKEEKNIYGLCFLKFDTKGQNIGKAFTKKRTTLFDLHFKEDDQGERAILFVSSIRKQYKHKLENDENFITEARMYYEMDKKNELLCFNLPIMICEYQMEGYTKNLKEHFLSNPNGYFRFFQEILEKDMRGVIFKKRIYAIKHYILFATLTKQKYDLRKIKGFYNKLLIIILWIPGKMKTKRNFKYIENVKFEC